MGLRPEMEPNLEELLINENDPLELRCRSSSKMIFIYPETDEEGQNVSGSTHFPLFNNFFKFNSSKIYGKKVKSFKICQIQT